MRRLRNAAVSGFGSGTIQWSSSPYYSLTESSSWGLIIQLDGLLGNFYDSRSN